MRFLFEYSFFFRFSIRRFSREEKVTFKDVRREVVREVTEVLEAFQEEEEVRFKEVDKKVAGNIHKKEYREFWLDKLKPDAWTCLLYTSDAADE